MAEVRFNNGDAISAAVLTGLGGYIVLEARQWDYMAPDGPGPGFFPIWYGVTLIVLSLIVIGARLMRIAQERRGPGAAATPGRAIDSAGKRREIYHALAVWAAFAVSIALLKVLGFLIVLSLLTLFIVGIIYRRPWKVAFAVAIGTSLGFYLVFPLALSVALPVGVLGL
jgi:putative tricarboxylic transport membrane protein